MVYETDFYTVRRPYSRPNITSYSVTAPRISVTTWKVKPSIRTSVLIGELDRIYHRQRPHLAYVPTEDFLNSRPLVDFDDETKLIRAETERLMKRIYTSVPHPRSTTPLQMLPYYGQHTTDKYSSARHHNTVAEDVLNMSYYNEPSARTIGRGHLACVTFAGGRGYPRRKHLYSDENRDIHDEIKVRSYYNKNRAYEEAMSLPTGFASYLLRLHPDNRNGTLTSSEKLHIINILKERKEKNTTADGDKTAPETMNGNFEKKSKSVDEIIIPIERETKLNRSKSKDYKTCEKSKTDIIGSMETSIITENLVKETTSNDISCENTNNTIKTISEEPLQKPIVPEEVPEPAAKASSVEKIIEITIETNETKELEEKSKENLKPSRKASKTKTPVEENEVKIVNKTEVNVQDNEKETVEREIMEEEKTQEESPKAPVPQLVNIVEEVKNEVIPDNKTEDLLQISNSEINTIENKNGSSRNIPIKLEKETTPLNDTDSKSENIEETASNVIQTETAKTTTKVISEQNIDENDAKIIDSIIETADEKNFENTIKNIEDSFTETMQQTVTGTSQEIIITNSQVFVSTSQETAETVTSSNEIEVNQQDPISEQVILEIEGSSNKAYEKHSQEIITDVQQTISVETKEISKNVESTYTIQSEDLSNQLNSESPTDSNIPVQEKTIEIEIERSKELTEPVNMIEEVMDLASPDAQKEPETEPLIEEPQSPELDLIYNKNKTNEVCEVLSDVGEEA